MTNFDYQLAVTSHGQALTVFANGDVYVADSSRADFDSLVRLARAGDGRLVDRINPAQAVAKRFVLSDRVTVENSVVKFDGDPVDDSISTAIIRYLEQGDEDWAPLVLFLDKLYSNPDENSRTQAYRWLAAHNFTIASDGDILGYKGVSLNNMSINTGYAEVDGEPMEGHVPNRLGSFISMPRSMVVNDPADGCNVGLHIGTWNYASSFGSKVLLVKFSPRDIVSVPLDFQGQKLRVCRYMVYDEVTEPLYCAVYWDGPELTESAENLLRNMTIKG